MINKSHLTKTKTKASLVNTDTSNFDDILSASEDTVQKALDILDNHGHPDTDVVVYDTEYTVRDAFDAALRNGINSGLTVTDEGGLNISWTEGVAFIAGSVFAVNEAGVTALTDNATNYLYVLKDNTTLQISTSEPSGEFALRSIVYTYDGDIHYQFDFPLMAGGLRGKLWAALRDVLPAAVISGCECSIDTDATNANDFKIGTGSYYSDVLDKHIIASILYSAGVGHGDNNVVTYYHA